MNKRNIIIPVKLPETKFTFNTGTNIISHLKATYPKWAESNKDRLEHLNAIHIYSKYKESYILIDGNEVTEENGIMIDETLHFVENVDLSLVSILAKGEVIIQIGTIG